MKIKHIRNRFGNDLIPHYLLCEIGKYVYYVAFIITTDSAYITDFNRNNAQMFNISSGEYEPTPEQKRVAIEQVFFKLQGLIDS
jgi:hypothetical protein